jgi:hypothetical protein
MGMKSSLRDLRADVDAAFDGTTNVARLVRNALAYEFAPVRETVLWEGWSTTSFSTPADI